MSEVHLEMGRRVLEQQPFSRVVGVRLERLEAGQAELALDLRDDHMQQHGYVHGGVISFLADNALAFAGGSVLGDVLTLEFKINYLKPGRGKRLIARARVTGSGRNQAVCNCEVLADDGDSEVLCAIAQGTIWKRG
jgi:uncharacterized protein (TIGR00369 family)